MTMNYDYDAQSRAHRTAVADVIESFTWAVRWVLGCMALAVSLAAGAMTPAADALPVPTREQGWIFIAAATALLVVMAWAVVVHRLWWMQRRARVYASDRGGPR